MAHRMTEPEPAPKPSIRMKSVWLLAYALLSAIEFVVTTAKSWIAEQISGRPLDPPPHP